MRSLGRAALSGMVWLTVARWSIRLANLATTVLLARLLSPEGYGLVALAVLVTSFLYVGNLGLQSAAVQQEEPVSRPDLDVAWTYDKLFFNGALAVLTVLSAPLLATVFGAPALAPVVRVLALVPLIQILENNALVVLTRTLDYRKRFVLEVANGLGMFLSVIPLALLLRNVWAYVISYLVGSLARAVASYLVYPVRPRYRAEWARARPLFRFGKWMIFLRVVTLLRQQLAQIVVGASLGGRSLAFFQIGQKMGSQVVADAYQTAHKVLFPVYSKLQSKPPKLAASYERAFELILLVMLPLCAGLFVVAEPLTLVVFGDEWLPTAVVLKIMAVASAVRIAVGSSHPLLRGSGRPQYEWALGLFYLATLLPLLMLITPRAGFVGSAYAVLAAELLQLPLWYWSLRRCVPVRAGRLARRVTVPLSSSLLMGGAVVLALGQLSAWPPLPKLALGIATGAVAYLALLWGIRGTFGWTAVDRLWALSTQRT